MMKTHKELGVIILLFASLNLVAQPVEYDKELGQQYSEAVELQLGIYNDLELTEFVAAIGTNLVQELGDQPFDYSFKIADTDITNAFALPGGYTYVTRGLLALVNDESELAGVMAHEIIHVNRRHSVQQMNRGGFLPGLFRLPGQIVGAFSPALGSLLVAPVDITTAAFKANYSRSHEKEADKEGVVLAASAGYDPNGLTVLLENLAAEAELLSGETEKAKLLDDHPVTDKRLKYLDKEIDNIKEANFEIRSKSILDVIDGMTFGQNPEQGVIIDNLFMHPDMRLFMQFPSEWETANTPFMVGAMQGEGEAIVVLAPTDNAYSSKEYCDSIVLNIPDEYASLIKENKPDSVNGFPGHSLILVDQSSTSSIYLHILWINVGTSVFQLSGYGLSSHKEDLETSMYSLRTLTEEERDGVQLQQIRIAEAYSGESLADLSERTGNVLDVKMTATMNSIDLKTQLKEGQKVKIVRESPYVSR